MLVKNAFTLVELMVVIAIIAILALIAIPLYQHYLDEARKSATISHLQGLALAEMSLKTNPDITDFITVNAGSSPEDAIGQLITAGFRPDSAVGFVALAVADGSTGSFIAYGAYQVAGSQVFVYDNVTGAGIRPYDALATYGAPLPLTMTVYSWDGGTNAVSATATLTISRDGKVSVVTTH